MSTALKSKNRPSRGAPVAGHVRLTMTVHKNFLRIS